MSVAAGGRLGPYDIISAIGAGGMGEVYRGRDARLQRDVAIKVLPDLLAHDPDRLARFQREAQVLASLNHPNIAQVYGIESGALVMEYVDGEDLSAVIARGPTPIEEALPIARQIADALEAAHEQGIVHRDLKPANVKVRADGRVRVLDFGLAKAVDPPDPSGVNAMNSPTLTVHATQMGVIVGTAAYMAPEQARGKAVDKRADIWGFGCVLFEILAARRPFDGDTVTDMLAAVVKEEPDWGRLPAATPQSLRRLIASCLQKDPTQRLRDIGDARIALERIAAGAADEPRAADAAGAVSASRPAIGVLAAIVIAAAALAAGITWLKMRPPPPQPVPVAHFVTPLPLEAVLLRSYGSGLAFSPDGGTIVFAAQSALSTTPVLYRRKLDALDVERIPTTEGAYAPFFSPDGKWIGFFTDSAVMKLAVDGGSVSKVSDRHGRFSRAAWAPDDTIILGTSSQASAPGALARVSAAGGEPAPLTTLAGKEILHQFPSILPDGQHIVFTVVSPDRYELAIAPLAGGAHSLLNLDGSGPTFVGPDHLVFARGDSIFAVGFDPVTNQIRGAPLRVLEDGWVFTTGAQIWMPVLGADRAGNVAYVNKGGTLSQLRWMAPAAAPLPIPEGNYRGLSLAPDGRRAAVTIGTAPGDVWVIDLDRGTRLRLTSSGGSAPIWSRDGSRIAYWNQTTGLMTVASDASGNPEVFLPPSNNAVLLPSAWTRDGKALIVTAEDRSAGRGVRNRDILLVRAGEKPVPLIATPSDERGGVLSPDDRWIAYASSVSGREEVYVRPFAGAGAIIPVSSDGGTLPRWPRADALFFLSPKGIARVPVTFNPLRPGVPELAAALTPTALVGADVTADGRVLVLDQTSETASRDVLHVLLHWGPSLR